jgi:D-beta-D-heptose 7-phosphate kinase/D-beta-D-heptose 1-phosphate adenosyltransferase
MNRKIKSLSALKKILRQLRRKNKKIIFTNGCFDLLHRGHVEYLKRAKSLGDALIIGLNSDESVKRLKGKSRPVNNLDDRAEVLAGLECVDLVTIFDEDTPLDLIGALRPDVLVKGADWKNNEIVGSELVRSYGGKVALVRYLKGYSTTSLLKKISAAKGI